MIFQALHEFAHREELMRDPNYEVKPVAWLVTVSKNGKITTVEGTHCIASKERIKRRARPVAKGYSVPREKALTSGDRAFLLFGKSEYVFGLSVEKDTRNSRPAEKLAVRFGLFRQKIKQCLDATNDDGVRAVYMALEDVAAGKQSVLLPVGVASSDLIAFIYAPDVDKLVSDRKKVRDYWTGVRERKVGASGTRQQCLVTGSNFSGRPGHFPPLKRVPGGRSTGVALVSYNSSAFESYGWKGNENAAICRDAAESCATALNRMLSPAFLNLPNACQTLNSLQVRVNGDTVICFWAAGRNEFIDDLQQLFLGRQPKRGGADDIIWRGWKNIVDDSSALYALTLTGTQGRAIVRGWFESTVTEIARNLQEHFADLDIVRNTWKPSGKELSHVVPLRILMDSLAASGRNDQVRSVLADQLLQCALRGGAYPMSALSRALNVTRAECGKSSRGHLERGDARAALIKAVLNRRYRKVGDSTHREIKRDMDPNNLNEGYLLGRLIAVIEKVQLTAINTSVVDRCFGVASVTPRSVFIRLLKNTRHQLRIARSDSQTVGIARWLEHQIDALADHFDPNKGGFPAHLNIEQQGMFVLGYHHQRHWLRMSKNEREAWAVNNGLNAENAHEECS